MSGHSKWSTIKHQKGIQDKKRGQLFSKLARQITVAVAQGGSGDPEKNFKLRLAIDKARQANVPKENINRAIARGESKGKKTAFTQVTFEGFGPEGTAVIVEGITDNKNRTIAEIKKFFEKRGGRLVDHGTVKYLFEKKGFLLVEKQEDPEKQILGIIDLGVEDVEETEAGIEVYTKPSLLADFASKLKNADFKLTSQELVLKPKNLINVEGISAEKVLKFLKELEERDDVLRVSSDANFIQ